MQHYRRHIRNYFLLFSGKFQIFVHWPRPFIEAEFVRVFSRKYRIRRAVRVMGKYIGKPRLCRFGCPEPFHLVAPSCLETLIQIGAYADIGVGRN